MSDRQCYVFLADVAERNEVLNLYCKVDGYTKEGAIEHVHEVLKTRGVAAAYKLLYVGIIDFRDVDQEIVDRQDTFFEKHDAVWLLNCSYA